MKHVSLISEKPASAQSTIELKAEFIFDILTRLELTSRSLPWGTKFPTDNPNE